MSKLQNLEPARVFGFFEEIAAIPHGSYHTGAISGDLADFAAKRGLEYNQDDTEVYPPTDISPWNIRKWNF